MMYFLVKPQSEARVACRDAKPITKALDRDGALWYFARGLKAGAQDSRPRAAHNGESRPPRRESMFDCALVPAAQGLY